MSAKRGTKTPREAASYAISDVVLGKVRGYPPWPGMIVDPDSVPENVSNIRPSTKKQTFYCVRFFPNSDHAWLVEKDISRLQPHEIAAYINEPAKKKGDLLEAYKIAQEPTEWLAQKKAEEEAEALEEDEDEDAEDDDAEAEVDQLESDAVVDPTSKSKKRKRTASDAAEKPSAKAKKGSSARAKKEAAAAPAEKKKGAAANASSSSAKGKRNGVKSKALVESEDDGENERSASGAEDAGPSHKASPPAAKKLKRDKEEEAEEAKEDPEAVKVRDWRHKLQKTFLSAKVPPKGEDMPDLDKLFKRVEECEVTIEQLQFSKIGKVMRHIAALTEPKVPRDAQYKFRERAKALVERWQAILTASKTGGNGSESGGNATAAKTTTAPAAAANTPTPANGVSAKSAVVDEPAVAVAVAPVLGAGEDAEAEVDAQGEKEDGVENGVAEATAAIDLNGKDGAGVGSDAIVADIDVPVQAAEVPAAAATAPEDVAMADA